MSRIAVARAIELVDSGMSYRRAGEILAAEQGRSLPYQPSSVANAIAIADGRRESGAARYQREKGLSHAG